MFNKPEKISYGLHKGKFQCTQYACQNNYGLQTGEIYYEEYPDGCCKLENPDVNDFGNDIWGCGDERYGNEVKQGQEKVATRPGAGITHLYDEI